MTREESVARALSYPSIMVEALASEASTALLWYTTLSGVPCLPELGSCRVGPEWPSWWQQTVKHLSQCQLCHDHDTHTYTYTYTHTTETTRNVTNVAWHSTSAKFSYLWLTQLFVHTRSHILIIDLNICLIIIITICLIFKIIAKLCSDSLIIISLLFGHLMNIGCLSVNHL